MRGKKINDTFARMYRSSQYRIWLWILGFFTMLVTFIVYRSKKGKDDFAVMKEKLRDELEAQGVKEKFLEDALLQVKKKNEYFKKTMSDSELKKQAKAIADKNFEQLLQDKAEEKAAMSGGSEVTMVSCYAELMEKVPFAVASVIISFPMYILMMLFMRPMAKYITERLFLMIFVLFGVTWLVFTILYIAPMDAATNILGQTATQEQIDTFNRVYGLDQPYFTQLVNTFKNLITFDLGNAYKGNEHVMTAILAKFLI